MDFTKISTEDLAKMSESELREYIHELIHAETNEQLAVQAAFLGPGGETVHLSDIVRALGEEKATELLLKLFNSATVRCSSMTKEDYDDLAKRIANGEEVTEDERRIFEAIRNSLNNDMYEYQTHTLGAILHVLDFSQNEAKYNASLADLSILFHILVLETMRNTKESRMYLYKDADTSVPMEMSQQMADSIMNTWRASLAEEPDQGMVVLALASALIGEIFKYENQLNRRIELPSVEYLRKVTGITEERHDEDEHECQCGGDHQCGDECQCKHETKDGSNNHKVLSFDQAMKNMIKS